MRIKYIGYSDDLSHPADRRRSAILMKSLDIEFVGNSEKSYDAIVLSGNANFYKNIRNESRPIVIDLVDGYLNGETSLLKDISRNLLRSRYGKSEAKFLTYTRHIEYALSRADAVVVPSIELAKLIYPFCGNVFVIPDDHSELQHENPEEVMQVQNNSRSFLWEGFGSNLKHLFSIAPQLDELLGNTQHELIIVSERFLYRWGNVLGKKDTLKQIETHFPLSFSKVRFMDWSLVNIKLAAKISKFAIIPISKNDLFASLKSENKLLSAWSMSLPVFVSPTDSYLRMLNLLELNGMAVSENWGSAVGTALEKGSDLIQVRARISEYIRLSHTQEELLGKWRYVLNSVLKKCN